MQDYEVTQDIVDHPLLETVSAGTTISADPAHPSIISLIEEGFLKALDAIEDVVEGSTEEVVPPAPEASAAPEVPAEESVVVPTAKPTHDEASIAAAASHPDSVAIASKYEVPPAPFESVKPMLYAFCKAMESHEGMFAPGENPEYPLGTRSWHDKNPGNLRFAGQESAIGEDRDGFCIFPTFEVGFQALINQVMISIHGGVVYKPQIFDTTMKAWRQQNFLDFLKIYASGKGDNPEAYAADVASKLGVPVETPMATLIA